MELPVRVSFVGTDQPDVAGIQKNGAHQAAPDGKTLFDIEYHEDVSKPFEIGRILGMQVAARSKLVQRPCPDSAIAADEKSLFGGEGLGVPLTVADTHAGPHDQVGFQSDYEVVAVIGFGPDILRKREPEQFITGCLRFFTVDSHRDSV